MKAIPVIFFAILLTGLAHITLSQKSTTEKFGEFLHRLQNTIEASSDGILPFMVKDNVIKNLKLCSTQFQFYCVQMEEEALWRSGQYSPISSLDTSIAYIFVFYKEKAKEGKFKQILNELQYVDPIGLNAYLTRNRIDYSSPNLMHFVLEYRKTTYERVPITASRRYHLSDFLEFVERLISSDTGLPFRLQIRLLANLWRTSNEFKELCIEYDVLSERESGTFSSASSLNKAINTTFKNYIKTPNSAEGRRNSKIILSEIQQVDPIGLNAYLTKKMEHQSSPTFMQSVKEFQTTMNDRVRLIESRTKSTYISIPDNIRRELTTEFRSLSHATMDLLIEIASGQFKNITMYPTSTYHSINDFKQHKSIDSNDVQIVSSGIPNSADVGHALCIQYHASSRKVRVYDSVMFPLNQIHRKIVSQMYPYNQGIEYKEPKTLQGKTEICGLFAMYYATMLLLGKDPAEQSFKLNEVHGEEGLYMRLHTLDMFANRRLVLMN